MSTSKASDSESNSHAQLDPMKYLVNVPVANLRREPIEGRTPLDRHQETQLLFNERLKGYGINNGWIFVEALEQQKCFADGEWGGYPGWVQADQLIEVSDFPAPNLSVIIPWGQIERPQGVLEVSLGTLLVGVEELPRHWRLRLPDGTEGLILKESVSHNRRSASWRLNIVNRGKQLLDSPYFWGGRSGYRPDWPKPFTSVDCSALVELLYRTEGVSLPRDAHDQFLLCDRCESADLQPGDLIFLAPSKKAGRIAHVMIFAGDDQFLEAEMKAEKVRLVPAQSKLGCSIKDLPYGYDTGEYVIYYGVPHPSGI